MLAPFGACAYLTHKKTTSFPEELLIHVETWVAAAPTASHGPVGIGDPLALIDPGPLRTNPAVRKMKT